MAERPKVVINGFGRVGRLVLRNIALNRPDIDVVGIGVARGIEAECRANLFKFDSSYGIYPGKVGVEDDSIIVDDRKIRFFASPDPAQFPWGEIGAEYVIEASGKMTDASKAGGHLQAGAKKIIITAPAKGNDVTIVLGVNEQDYDPEKHRIVSAGSCTTNCIAPVSKVLEDTFGIEAAFMSTVHAYTNDQQVLDKTHKDARRARSCALSIIPTSTGAAKALGLVVPSMKGKMDGLALRVPVPTVSIIDLTALLKTKTTVAEVNEAFIKASQSEKMKGILGVTTEPVVSVDFKGDCHSTTVDLPLTQVLVGNLIKVFAWYDNEWAYCCRVGELVEYMNAQKPAREEAKQRQTAMA